MEIPSTMKALIIEKIGGPLSIQTVEVPQPKDDEILVKIEATTINPSDCMLIRTPYFPIQYPSKGGLEGYGTVVSSASDQHKNLIGKKVSFWSFHAKAWAEYTTVPAKDCMELDECIPIDQATFSYLNPTTCWGLFNLINNKKNKGVIITAGASACGKILSNICKDSKINVISIVRNDEHKKICLENGADVVLNMKDLDFFDQLKLNAAKLECTMAFDCINGSFACKLLSNMPYGSKLVIYGSLSGEPTINLPAFELMIGNKSIEGFAISNFVNSLDESQHKDLHHTIKKNLTTLCKTEISKKFTLDEFNLALDYYDNNASKGKVLITI
jgi:NADPH2:quinone reductase